MKTMGGAGLCATCAHVRVIESRRGSRFFLCERSRRDPAFPRYPRLPMLECDGYEPVADMDSLSPRC